MGTTRAKIVGSVLVASMAAAGLFLWLGGGDDAGAVAALESGEVVSPDAMSDTETVVYLSPTCGCCYDWVDHMEEAGFDVTVVERHDLLRVKHELGVARELSSCHTAVVDGYVVEGHVPADLVHRLLEERPDVTGLAVPNMPIGSPGMEIEGMLPEPYDIVTFDDRGETRVYDSR